MININLLDSQAPSKRKSASPPIGGKVVAIMVSLPIIAVGGYAIWKYGIPQIEKRLHPQKTETAQAPIPSQIVKEDVQPSSYVSANAVEDVIRDDVDSLSGDTGVDLQSVPYDKLNPIERLNFERFFAKNVCDLFVRTVPAGVDFRSMHADSFSTFSAEGFSKSRQEIADVLLAVKKEHVQILPQPLTQINPSGSVFHFIVTCRSEFVFDAASPYLLSMNELPPYSDLDLVLRDVQSAAVNSDLRLSGLPTQSEAWLDGNTRCFKYHIDGSGSYGQFVAFVNSLVHEKSPVAFASMSVRADKPGQVHFDADLRITTQK